MKERTRSNQTCDKAGHASHGEAIAGEEMAKLKLVVLIPRRKTLIKSKKADAKV